MDVSTLNDIAQRGGYYGKQAQLAAIRSLSSHLDNPSAVSVLNDIARWGGYYGKEAQMAAIAALGGMGDST